MIPARGERSHLGHRPATTGYPVQTALAEPIRVLLAALGDRQRGLVEAAFRRATPGRRGDTRHGFELETVDGRGLEVLRRAAGADVVLFALEYEELPGEASHVFAEYPGVKIVGVDQDGRARLVLGAVLEPLSSDLPTVVRWIARPPRDDEPRPLGRGQRMDRRNP